MSTVAAPSRIAVWTEDGVPVRLVRLVWRSVRYRVTDTPTPLCDELDHPFLTHPHRRQIGWRFQGTPERGDSLMFDVLVVAEGWRLLRAFD